MPLSPNIIRTNNLKASAFTLIELSIVLVIIGLIVGGVLVGQDLIAAAKNRKQLSELQKYSAAIQTFRLKYNALPGDISDPATFGLYVGNPGNGNKIITNFNGSLPVTSLHSEGRHFFVHLSQAGLIDDTFLAASAAYHYCEGTGINRQAPKLTVGNGGIIMSHYNGYLYYYMGLSACKTGNPPSNYNIQSLWSIAGIMPPASAHYIDSKTDDGNPGTGTVIAVTRTTGLLDTSDGNCVENSATTYNFSKETNECRLYVRAE